MIEIAGRDQRYRASVVREIRIVMNATVKFGRSAERQRPKKSGGSKDRDKRTRHRAAPHWGRLSRRLMRFATVFCDRGLRFPKTNWMREMRQARSNASNWDVG